MIRAIFKSDETGAQRMIGYARTEYSSSDDGEVIVEATEADLAEIFEAAPVEELAGADAAVEAAVDDPLSYRDFLVLEDSGIVFDGGYTRSDE